MSKPTNQLRSQKTRKQNLSNSSSSTITTAKPTSFPCTIEGYQGKDGAVKAARGPDYRRLQVSANVDRQGQWRKFIATPCPQIRCKAANFSTAPSRPWSVNPPACTQTQGQIYLVVCSVHADVRSKMICLHAYQRPQHCNPCICLDDCLQREAINKANGWHCWHCWQRRWGGRRGSSSSSSSNCRSDPYEVAAGISSTHPIYFWEHG